MDMREGWGDAASAEEVLLRQIRRKRLGELVAAHVAEFGEFTPEERAAAHAVLHGNDPATTRPSGGPHIRRTEARPGTW